MNVSKTYRLLLGVVIFVFHMTIGFESLKWQYTNICHRSAEYQRASLCYLTFHQCYLSPCCPSAHRSCILRRVISLCLLWVFFLCVTTVDGERLVMKGARLTCREMLSSFQSRCKDKDPQSKAGAKKWPLVWICIYMCKILYCTIKLFLTTYASFCCWSLRLCIVC